VSTTEAVTVPAARGTYEARDVEEIERERGNTEFKAGNFTAAVKCYTKCLGMKQRNFVAFSNRAMAYLKLKEYARAVVSFVLLIVYM
jgi:tetratricopeptide (TPR) repeat protein